MNKTKIEWCDSTWNPVTGCLHGCEYCYARKIANRFGKLEKGCSEFEIEDGTFKAELYIKHDNPYPFLFKPTFHKYRLNEPAKKTKGQNIFVCSMADLFGYWVPDEWINEVFEACENAPQHNYLFLTKNVERYCEIETPLMENLYFGTSITKEAEMHKFNYLPADYNNTFVSMEPILEDLKPSEHNILFKQVNWVILGAETGNRKNKVVPKKEWIDNIVEECKRVNVPVFMKDSLIQIVGEENMLREFPEGLRR